MPRFEIAIARTKFKPGLNRRKKARPFYNRFMTCHLNGILTLEFSQFLEFSVISITYFASPLMSDFFVIKSLKIETPKISQLTLLLFGKFLFVSIPEFLYMQCEFLFL